MHNVGFGDYFEISNCNALLIVDCGTIKFKDMNSQYSSFKKMVEKSFDSSFSNHNFKGV